MVNSAEACSFYGCKSVCFSFGYDEEKEKCIKLKRALLLKIRDIIRNGILTFYAGMDIGVDIWCSEIVMMLKKENPNLMIRLIAVIPYEEQASNWSEYYRERYFNLLAECDNVIMLQTHFTADSMQNRNEYLVRHSDYILAVCNGRNYESNSTIDLAVRNGLAWTIIDSHDHAIEYHCDPYPVIRLHK